jgi:hypothetical protein
MHIWYAWRFKIRMNFRNFVYIEYTFSIDQYGLNVGIMNHQSSQTSREFHAASYSGAVCSSLSFEFGYSGADFLYVPQSVLVNIGTVIDFGFMYKPVSYRLWPHIPHIHVSSANRASWFSDKVKVTLRQTTSRSVSPGFKTHEGLTTWYLFLLTFTSIDLSITGAPSDGGRVCHLS